jgi:hypothetical protein
MKAYNQTWNDYINEGEEITSPLFDALILKI